MKGRDALFSHDSDEWETPDWVFKRLDLDYHFTLDPCATPENARCKKFYTKEQNGLSKSWSGESVFVNPPYSRIHPWASKCKSESWESWQNDKIRTIVALLVPARTDTKWFHQVIHYATRLIFIRGRLKFSGSKNSAPFPSMVLVFDPPNWTGNTNVCTMQVGGFEGFE